MLVCETQSTHKVSSFKLAGCQAQKNLKEVAGVGQGLYRSKPTPPPH